LEISWSWLGGFIDGEGCFSAVKRRYVKNGRKYEYILGSLVIGQKDESILHQIDEFLRRYGVKGCVYERRGHNMYAYTFQGRRKFLMFAEMIMPYLRHPYRIAQLRKVMRCVRENRKD